MTSSRGVHSTTRSVRSLALGMGLCAWVSGCIEGTHCDLDYQTMTAEDGMPMYVWDTDTCEASAVSIQIVNGDEALSFSRGDGELAVGVQNVGLIYESGSSYSSICVLEITSLEVEKWTRGDRRRVVGHLDCPSALIDAEGGPNLGLHEVNFSVFAPATGLY